MRNNSMYFYKQVIPEPCIKSLDAKFKNQKLALYFRTGHYVLFKKILLFFSINSNFFMARLIR